MRSKTIFVSRNRNYFIRKGQINYSSKVESHKSYRHVNVMVYLFVELDVGEDGMNPPGL